MHQAGSTSVMAGDKRVSEARGVTGLSTLPGRLSMGTFGVRVGRCAAAACGCDGSA